MFTKESFLSFYHGQPNETAAGECYDAVFKALGDAGILTDLTLIGALATVRVEVGRTFLPVAENALYAVRYEFRKDLGNGIIGDGVRYRGRGYIQITGRTNYEHYGQKLGIDLIGHPDLALDRYTAAKILAWYFNGRGVANACNAKDWVLARKLVNGGTNGLTAFLSIVEQYTINIKNMETLEITNIEYNEELNKTTIVYDTFDSGDLSHRSGHEWVEEGQLTQEQVLALAISRADAGIKVVLNLSGPSGQPVGDGSVGA